MIYAIGDPLIYEPLLDNLDYPPKKLGRGLDYSGGSVWFHKEEAQEFADKNDYRVYGVLACWEEDTEPNLKGEWNDLLRNSTLVRLGPSDNMEEGTERIRLIGIIDRLIKRLRSDGSYFSVEIAMQLQMETHGVSWDPCPHKVIHHMTRIGTADDRYGCDKCRETFNEIPPGSNLRSYYEREVK